MQTKQEANPFTYATIFTEHLLCAGTTARVGVIVEKIRNGPCLTELTLWEKLGEAVPVRGSQRRPPVVEEKPLCSQTDKAIHQPFCSTNGSQGLLLVVTTLRH